MTRARLRITYDSNLSPRNFKHSYPPVPPPLLPPSDRRMSRIHRCRHRSLGCCMLAVLFFILADFAFASSGVFESENSWGNNRRLLQAKKRCPIDFEFKNYTIITSQCRPPDYPAKLCCRAFKQFACPYAKQLNDLTNDCASTMFSYINLYGHYPPGLFASTCRADGSRGLLCPSKSA